MVKKLLVVSATLAMCACTATDNRSSTSAALSSSSVAVSSQTMASSVSSMSSAAVSSSVMSSSSAGLNIANCGGAALNGSSNTPVRINQVGFMPNAQKIAVVEKPSNAQFYIARANDNVKVYCGEYSTEATWAPSGEAVRKADFTALTVPGTYYLGDIGGRKSYTFEIANDVFDDLEEAALKAYYFNRASAALPAQYAGVWQRGLGHPDTNILVHASAVSNARPEGTQISAPKGWYDAGDYNKYIVNSGISVYTLLAAYEHYSDHFKNLSVNIPESSDSVPDILNEVMWNLEWMEKMQDPDGGVYHKLTTKNFVGTVMPDQAGGQRYVVQRTTAATLNFAAVMAVASRIYSEFEQAFPGKSAAYRQVALAAWNWAEANPSVTYRQPADIATGAYGDSDLTDEFAWAAAELYLLTGQASYLERFKSIGADVIAPWWGGVATLGYISLAEHGKDTMSNADYTMVKNAIIGAANGSVAKYKATAYGVPLDEKTVGGRVESDFYWGSNGAVANQAFVLMYANRLSPSADYVNASTAIMDYLLGRNATGYSFVTGAGAKAPMDIHHRPSYADNIDDPVPGFLVGGPHSQQPETPKCEYPSTLPAKSFSDTWCSYSTNEVTINWNAPLVYLLGAMQNIAK